MSQGKSSSNLFLVHGCEWNLSFYALINKQLFFTDRNTMVLCGFPLASVFAELIHYLQQFRGCFSWNISWNIISSGLLLFNLIHFMSFPSSYYRISNTMPRRTTLKNLLGFRGEGFCSS